MSSWHRRLRPAAPEPEFPDQLVGGASGDSHESVVDAEQVVSGADAEQVGIVVAAALSAIFDVMDMRGGPAAAPDLAAVAVAAEDSVAAGPSLLDVGLPDRDEVRRHLHQALAE